MDVRMELQAITAAMAEILIKYGPPLREFPIQVQPTNYTKLAMSTVTFSGKKLKVNVLVPSSIKGSKEEKVQTQQSD
ncbi:MAG: hypothetical protein IPK62_06435 [Bacteroidetes bacterium]|nr:hypothetical protein [Bacteroidota bacterium]